MYSEEILYFLKAKKFLVSLSEYLFIIESPQVNHVHYANDTFYISTDDGYNFSLKIDDNNRK